MTDTEFAQKPNKRALRRKLNMSKARRKAFILSWEDDYFGQAITEDPIEKKDNVVYDACFDDVYLGEDHGIAV